MTILIWGTPILLNKGWPKKSHVLQGAPRRGGGGGCCLNCSACMRARWPKKTILECISTFCGKEEMDFSPSFFGPPSRREGGVPPELMDLPHMRMLFSLLCLGSNGFSFSSSRPSSYALQALRRRKKIHSCLGKGVRIPHTETAG